MYKGVSPILASVLIVLVAISLSGAFLVFTQSTSTQLTEGAQESQERLQAELDVRPVIEGVSDSQVFVRNGGSDSIEEESVTVFIGDINVNYSVGSPIQPGDIGTITITNAWKAGLGEKSLRVTSGALSDSVRVKVSPNQGAVLDMRFEDTGKGQTLIDNGGFENYGTSPGAPDNWEISRGFDGETYEESDESRSGEHSIRMVSTGTNDGRVELRQTVQGIDPGKSYVVEAYGRAENDGIPYMHVYSPSEGFIEDTPVCGDKNVDDWQRYIITFEAKPSTEYRVRIGDCAGTPPAGATVYWDDIRVQEIEANDESGSSNHGILTGGTKNIGPDIGVQGRHGNGYEFLGSTAVEVADSPSLDITGPFTLAAWVNTGSSPQYETVIAKRDIASGPSAYNLRMYSDRRLEVAASGTNDATTATGGAVIEHDTWHHVIGTYDGSYKRIYVDGVLRRWEATSGSVSTNDLPVTIGTDEEYTRQWTGIMDEVLVLNQAYTPAELYVVNGV